MVLAKAVKVLSSAKLQIEVISMMSNKSFVEKLKGQDLIQGPEELLKLYILTLPVPRISESCIEIKIKLNCYFYTSLQCLKRFLKALKAFIKYFEAPQRSVKIKI